MNRPHHLPDFQAPPLNEVFVGVQFTPPPGYQQIRAGEVWGLFKDHFPKVQELPPIPPMFETFGLSQPGQIGFEIMAGAMHSRFWFLSSSGDELIQFQNDRIHHNWRKVGDQSNEYPRFEKMIDSFSKELILFEDYITSLSAQSLTITQCEVCYINHIYLEESEAFASAQDWLKFLNFKETPPEDFSVVFRYPLKNLQNDPFGRLICEASSATGLHGKKMMAVALTARGRPSAPDISSAIDFLNTGRRELIKLFTDITTDKAHKHWERTQ